MRIFLVRHGSTALNAEKRFRGSSMAPLSEDGWEEVRQVAVAIHEDQPSMTPCAIYTSPLPRAIESAQIWSEILTNGSMQPQVLRKLTSMEYGEWEGRTETEIASQYPEQWKQYVNAIHEVVFPGGESLSDLVDRTMAAVIEIAIRHMEEDGVVIIVTHQVVTRSLLCAFLDLPLSYYWRWGQDTACLNVLEVSKKDDKLQFDVINSNWKPHLPK